MRIAFLLSLFSSVVLAQSPANWQNAEREKLLTGVGSVPKLGSPGPVAIWGNFAFPVLAAAEGGKSEMALAAEAGFGKGRVLIFGHNSYIDGGNAGSGGVGTLLVNAVKWVSGKEKPRIGVHGTNLVAFLDSRGFRSKKVAGALDKPQRLRCCHRQCARHHE